MHNHPQIQNPRETPPEWLMPEHIRERIEHLKEPDWEVLEAALTYLEKGFNLFSGWDGVMLLSRLDSATLDQLPLDMQKRMFEKLAREETVDMLNSYKFYISRPYGKEVFRQAVLMMPDVAVELLHRNQEAPIAKRIEEIIVQNLGREHFDEEMSRLNRSFFRRVVGTT